MTRGLEPSSRRGERSVTLRPSRAAAALPPSAGPWRRPRPAGTWSPARVAWHRRWRDGHAAAAQRAGRVMVMLSEPVPARADVASARADVAPGAQPRPRPGGRRVRLRSRGLDAARTSRRAARPRPRRATSRPAAPAQPRPARTRQQWRERGHGDDPALRGTDRDRERAPGAAGPGSSRRRSSWAGDAIVAGTWTQRSTPPAVTGVIPARSRVSTGSRCTASPVSYRRCRSCRSAWRGRRRRPAGRAAGRDHDPEGADRLLDPVHGHRVGDGSRRPRMVADAVLAATRREDREPVVDTPRPRRRARRRPQARDRPQRALARRWREGPLDVVRPALEIAVAGEVAAEPVDAAGGRGREALGAGELQVRAAAWPPASRSAPAGRRDRGRRRAGGVATATVNLPSAAVDGCSREPQRGPQPLGRRRRERERGADHRRLPLSASSTDGRVA